MASIIVVNETNPSSLQVSWWNNPTSCLRPAPDFGMPIICTVSPVTNPTIKSQLVLAYKECCPDNADGTDIYVTMNYCEIGCFTRKAEAAAQWSPCIERASTAFLEQKKTAGTPLNLTLKDIRSRCETVDYATLRKNMAKTNAGSVLGVETWVMLLLAGLGLAGVAGHEIFMS